MKYLFLLPLIFAMGCMGGGGGGESSSGGGGVTGSSGPFQLVSVSLHNGTKNVPTSNFSLTYQFNHSIDPNSAKQGLNANTDSTVVKLMSAFGSEAINLNVSGSSMTVTLAHPSVGLRPNTNYSLAISTDLKDTNGKNVESTADLVVMFTTSNGNDKFPGFVTVSLFYSVSSTDIKNGVNITHFMYSLGLKSQVDPKTGIVKKAAAYDDAQAVPSLQMSPVFPIGAFSTKKFSAKIVYPFRLSTQYYFAVQACTSRECSDYSGEAHYKTPTK